jgi:hypothetical protein
VQKQADSISLIREVRMPALRHKTGFRGPSPDVGKATQFKRGQPSANPGGRPSKFDRILSQAMRAQLAEKVTEDRTYASSIGENVVKVLEQQLAYSAQTGQFRKELVPLLTFVTDRLEGKPVQPVEDQTNSIESRPVEDLSFWLRHKHFPEESCQCSEDVKRSPLPQPEGDA